MNPFKYTVSFRVEHPEISPHEISAKLSLIPSTSWMAGDRRRAPNDIQLNGRYKTTYWSYTFKESRDMALADSLESFTMGLEPHKEFLLQIRSTGGRCEYFIGWFSDSNSGEIFTYQLLSKIASLQIDLALDIYGTKVSQ